MDVELFIRLGRSELETVLKRQSRGAAAARLCWVGNGCTLVVNRGNEMLLPLAIV